MSLVSTRHGTPSRTLPHQPAQPDHLLIQHLVRHHRSTQSTTSRTYVRVAPAGRCSRTVVTTPLDTNDQRSPRALRSFAARPPVAILAGCGRAALLPAGAGSCAALKLRTSLVADGQRCDGTRPDSRTRGCCDPRWLRTASAALQAQQVLGVPHGVAILAGRGRPALPCTTRRFTVEQAQDEA